MTAFLLKRNKLSIFHLENRNRFVERVAFFIKLSHAEYAFMLYFWKGGQYFFFIRADIVNEIQNDAHGLITPVVVGFEFIIRITRFIALHEGLSRRQQIRRRS